MRVTVLALALCAWPGDATRPVQAAATPSNAGDEERPMAPPFTLRTLDGEQLDLATLLKKGPVLLDFWATWCKPCVTSLPEVDALSRTYGPRGLTVVGVSIDGPRNGARVRPFVSRLKLGYAIGLDEDGSLQQDYRVTAVPTALLIDRDGHILLRRQGYLPGEGARLREALDTLLPAPAAADSSAR
jgi:peroxiredoxin